MSSDYDKAVDALAKDVHDLRAEMKDIIAAVKARAESHVEGVTESAAHRIEQVRDAATSIGRSCHDGVKTCAAKIEEHPVASLLAALGVGLVLGGLIRYRRR